MCKKFSYSEVKLCFEKHGCQLLSQSYNHSKQKLQYVCCCGSTSEIEFRNFKQGMRCQKCRYKRSFETNKQNHNGNLCFQTSDFLNDRKTKYLSKYGVDNPLKNDSIKKQRKETNLKKYGVEEVSQSPSIVQKQRQGFIDKYNVSHFMHNPESKKKFTKTLLEKYGVPSLAFLSRPASKESQELFWKIQNQLPTSIQDKSHFAELNREFVLTYASLHFKYDFVNTKILKAIEYNGKNFHPLKTQLDNEVKWCVFHPQKTVKEAREYENKKYKALEERGFSILTVWDYEYHKDASAVINKCLNFLMREIQQL